VRTPVVLGRIAKVSAVVVVSAAIAWQAQSEHSASGHSVQNETISPLLKYRAAQVREHHYSMRNRFELSKAYYGSGDALLEAAELLKQAKLEGQQQSTLTKS